MSEENIKWHEKFAQGVHAMNSKTNESVERPSLEEIKSYRDDLMVIAEKVIKSEGMDSPRLTGTASKIWTLSWVLGDPFTGGKERVDSAAKLAAVIRISLLQSR